MVPRRNIRLIGLIVLCLYFIQGTVYVQAEPNAAAQDSAVGSDASALGKVDERQDVPELRSLHSKSYRTSIPGQYKEVIYDSVIHYIGSDEKYYDINTSVTDENAISQLNKPVSSEIQQEYQQAKDKRKEADKAKKSIPNEETSYYALQVPYKLVIPKNFAKGYTIGSGKDQITFIPQNAQKSIGAVDKSDKSVIRYDNVWPSTTVKLSILPDGLKEDIILQDANAPTRLEFEVKGALDRNLVSGALRLLPAWLEDSKGVKRDVAMTTQTKGKKTYIALTWDNAGLSYPILIDPSVNVTYSNSFYYCTNTSTITGGSFLVSTDPYKQCESYITFNTSSIPKNADIKNASVTVSVLVNSNSNYDVRARLLTTPVSQSSSTGRPQYSASYQSTQYLIDNSGSKGQSYSWDATGMIADTFRNGTTSIGFYPSNTNFGTASGVFAYVQPYLSVYYDLNTQYQYDANSRLTATRLATGHLNSNSYDRNGNLLKSALQYNLLENGDFNLGGFNWNLGAQMQIGQKVSKDTFSLGFASAAATTQASATSSFPIAVGPHDQYTLSGYLMDNTTSGSVYLTWKEYNYYYGVVSTGSKLLSSNKGTNAWEFKSVSFIPSIMTSWMTVEIVADSGTKGSAYFDTIKLSPGIRNADFEKGQADWTNGGIMYIYKPSTKGHNNSDYVTGYNYPWTASTSVSTVPDIPVEPLRNYVYGAWFKNVSNSGNYYVRLDEYSANNQLVKSTKLDANNLMGLGWVYKEIGFQTAQDTRFLRVVVQMETGAGDIYVDDMRLDYKG